MPGDLVRLLEIDPALEHELLLEHGHLFFLGEIRFEGLEVRDLLPDAVQQCGQVGLFKRGVIFRLRRDNRSDVRQEVQEQ
jgi:hypothetical protein